MSVKISVILPIYNMQNYIEECLESVVNQTFKDIEIICVNDFSMDNSMTIVKDYARKDNRIKIINNEKNRGLGGARNAGLEVANGDYIVFVDTDDKIAENMLEVLYKSISESSSDMAFCDVLLWNNDGTTEPCKPFHNYDLAQNKEFYPNTNFENFTDMWPSAWNKIYKKNIIDQNNIRYMENILYEDHSFYYEYVLACKKVVYCPEALYFYRHNRNDSIMSNSSSRIFEIFDILEIIKNIFHKNLKEQEYQRIMPKIAVRLIWERSINLKRKNPIKRKFINKAKAYLSQFKHRSIIKYKDNFIKSSEEFLETRLEYFFKHFFLFKDYKTYRVIFILGIKIQQKNALFEIFEEINNLQTEIVNLKCKLNK